MLMKGKTLKCMILFTFGTGKDENLFTNIAVFFDREQFTNGLEYVIARCCPDICPILPSFNYTAP